MEHTYYPWETRESGAEGPQGLAEPLADSMPTAEAAPAAPEYVAARAGEGAVLLRWGNSGGAEGYLLLRGENPARLKLVAAVEETTYIDQQAGAANTWYYAVRAYNRFGQSAPALSPAVKTKDGGAGEPPESRLTGKRLRLKRPAGHEETYAERETAKTAPPAAPTALRAAARGTCLIGLSWEHSEQGVEFRIYRSETPWNSYGLIAETKEAAYLDTVPRADAKYYYFVQAVRAGAAGEASPMAEAHTFPKLPAPEPPRGLRAIPANGGVELQWQRGRGAAAYAVYARELPSGEFCPIGHTPDLRFFHEAPEPEGSREYRVQSYHDTGASEPVAVSLTRSAGRRSPLFGPAVFPAQAAPRRFPSFPTPNPPFLKEVAQRAAGH
ncbi:MAG: hypothetical protein LBG83_00505 [Oscillospiraceae bacterium]|jgi:hypothetical protein|nr:hypothetical protein [Oscillospiraceae bacterium]